MKGSGHGLNLHVSVPKLNVYKRYMSHELENDPWSTCYPFHCWYLMSILEYGWITTPRYTVIPFHTW